MRKPKVKNKYNITVKDIIPVDLNDFIIDGIKSVKVVNGETGEELLELDFNDAAISIEKESINI